MKLRQFAFAAALGGVLVLHAFAQDPPTRVARLNYVNGNVSIQPAGIDDWSPAAINRPLTTGDYLWCDQDGRAELHLNNATIRLSSTTSAGFLNLDDRFAQIRFSQGEMILRVRRMGEDDSFEVDTPNAAITLLREGEYRFNADPDRGTTFVVVRHGEAEVTGGGQAFSLRAGDSVQLSGTDQLAYDVEYAPEPDGFESWAGNRDAREARSVSARYLPPDVVGYEDLDAYGSWRVESSYGPVWYPTVDASWAPYRNGHWAWIEPWGWSWVDDMPWGFAPCHYGRWSFFGDRWGWIPGPVSIYGGGAVAVVRPVYAPALVAFIGGGSWGVGLSIGGPAVGWVPLGPGEVYTPAYQVSQNYFRTVNVSSTTIVNTVNITNVYNNVYVNKTVTVNQTYVNMKAPNAVTAVPQNAFASGQAVKAVAVSVPRAQLAQVQNVPMRVAPSVAPTRQAVAPMAGRAPAARPPARFANAPVVAKVAPPAAPVPFAAKQAALQQNAGKPLNIQAVRQAAPPRPAPASTVRVAPPAKVVAAPVQPGRPPAPGANRPPQAQPQPAQAAPRTAQPAPPPERPAQVQPRPAQPAPPPARPAEAQPRPAQPAPQPRPAQPTPPPARPAEAQPRPAQPPPRPAEAQPRPAQPPPRPAEAQPRPVQPPPRPAEAQPHPQPPPSQHGAPPPQQQKQKEKEKPKPEKEQQR